MGGSTNLGTSGSVGSNIKGSANLGGGLLGGILNPIGGSLNLLGGGAGINSQGGSINLGGLGGSSGNIVSNAGGSTNSGRNGLLGGILNPLGGGWNLLGNGVGLGSQSVNLKGSSENGASNLGGSANLGGGLLGGGLLGGILNPLGSTNGLGLGTQGSGLNIWGGLGNGNKVVGSTASTSNQVGDWDKWNNGGTVKVNVNNGIDSNIALGNNQKDSNQFSIKVDHNNFDGNNLNIGHSNTRTREVRGSDDFRVNGAIQGGGLTKDRRQIGTIRGDIGFSGERNQRLSHARDAGIKDFSSYNRHRDQTNLHSSSQSCACP